MIEVTASSPGFRPAVQKTGSCGYDLYDSPSGNPGKTHRIYAPGL